MYRLLIIDDDTLLLETLKTYFSKYSFTVLCAENAAQGLPIIEQNQLDCIILDIALPDQDGFQICRRARETTFLPVIFLSNYSEEENRIQSFTSGGDDFVSKPFSMEELRLRVIARIKSRHEDRPPLILDFSGLTIDTGSRTVTCRGVPAGLSRIEFDILLLLASHPERIFTYEQIYDAVWHEPMNESRHNLQARMAELRQKLSLLCPGKNYIRTLRHKGYQFSLEN